MYKRSDSTAALNQHCSSELCDPRNHLDGVDVFDYYFMERTVRACSRRTRTSKAERRPNAPLITPPPPTPRLLTLW